MTTLQNIPFNKTAIHMLGVIAFAVAAVAMLFAFEAVTPLRQATNEALAWQCQSITATPDTVHAGEPVTLEWSFGGYEEGITVTIDQIPGQEWDGVSGSTVVYPTETTRYRVVAHKDSLPTLVYDCCTTVTVLPPENPCEDVTLHLEEQLFTYSGPPALSHYTVQYCDGTTSGKIEGSWSDPVTIHTNKEIQSVFAKGGQCEIEETRPCTPPEEPTVPHCPFTATDGIVIDFNGGKERSDATVIRSDDVGQHEITKNVDLTSGTYTVKTASWDGYNGRETVTQPQEQWNVEVGDGATSFATVGPTTDIQDQVREDTQLDTFTNALIFGTDATKLSVVHSAYKDTSSANSVVPICVALKKKPVVPTPSCDLTANPNTITVGDNTTISWSSDHVTSVDIMGIGTGLATASSTTVSPATTTTYVGTFYTDTGSTLTCEDTVVVEPKEPTPSCELTVNPTSIKEGASTILSWSGVGIDSVDITDVGTGLAVASSTTISPATTTTYIGTFYKTAGGTLTCEDTVTVTPPDDNPTPQCSMNISPATVDKDTTATLTWTSSDVVNASINQNIGTVALDGSRVITVYNDTTYTGTFTDADGNDITCAASVSIRTGGGGGCINCGDDDDDDDDDGGGGGGRKPKPEIVLGKTISKTGSFVTLSQVPYTGFKAGPLLTIGFWLFVLFVSFVIAYFITQYKPFERFQFVMSKRAAAGHTTPPQDMDYVQKSVVTEELTHRPIVLASSSMLTGSSNGEDVHEIEERAHNENILLSPEALRMIQKMTQEKGAEASDFLTELFERAKSEFPREDGWILLSKERAEGLVQTKQEEPSTPEHDDNEQQGSVTDQNVTEKPFRVEQKKISNERSDLVEEAPVPQASQSVRSEKTASAASAKNNVVARFIDHLILSQKKEAYDLLRNISSRGVDLTTFMTLVVRQLDEVYKHRIEGNRSPESELVKKTQSWSNSDFEKVLGILVECVDYSYSNDRIGTKIALAKAFEHFEQK